MGQPKGDLHLMDTSDEEYARRLVRKQHVWWKRALHVQAPYRWNLRRQGLGRTLDIGCGVGRNLEVLAPGSIGVDHNLAAITVARELGHNALTVDDFLASDEARPAAFDGLLLAHIVEHLPRADALKLLQTYLPYVRPGGRVFFVCPQERGYHSDPTHVEWTTENDLVDLAISVDLVPDTPYSFPFPRWMGRAFIYNEFCLLAHRP